MMAKRPKGQKAQRAQRARRAIEEKLYRIMEYIRAGLK
jgi:hypothetical protein